MSSVKRPVQFQQCKLYADVWRLRRRPGGHAARTLPGMAVKGSVIVSQLLRAFISDSANRPGLSAPLSGSGIRELTIAGARISERRGFTPCFRRATELAAKRPRPTGPAPTASLRLQRRSLMALESDTSELTQRELSKVRRGLPDDRYRPIADLRLWLVPGNGSCFPSVFARRYLAGFVIWQSDHCLCS
jgi:hypothetical protein